MNVFYIHLADSVEMLTNVKTTGLIIFGAKCGFLICFYYICKLVTTIFAVIERLMEL